MRTRLDNLRRRNFDYVDDDLESILCTLCEDLMDFKDEVETDWKPTRPTNINSLSQNINNANENAYAKLPGPAKVEADSARMPASLRGTCTLGSQNCTVTRVEKRRKAYNDCLLQKRMQMKRRGSNG